MTAAFFPDHAGLVVFGLYLLGPVMAILSGLFLKRSLFKGEPAPFLLELPPYRMPTLKNIWLHVWERVRDFLTRAGTIIAAMSVLVWFLQNFGMDLHMVADTADSILAKFGSFIAPVFAPMGFGVWQAAVALLTGLIAKEAVVSSMSLFYGFSLTDYAAAGSGDVRHLYPGGGSGLPGLLCPVYPLRGGYQHHPAGDGQRQVDGR